VLYYGSLYLYKEQLIEEEIMIHLCVVYPSVDFILILFSFIAITRVKSKKNELIENEKFKEYKSEAGLALSDILYLPQEFESDDGEEDF